MSPHFWPSGRLWEKFLIGLFYVPGLFSILVWLFVLSAFSSPGEQPRYFWLFLLTLIGGPVAAGCLLRWPWRAIGRGIALVVALPVIWYTLPDAGAGLHLIDGVPEASIAAMGLALLLELTAGDADERKGRIGLAFGLAVAVILAFAYNRLAGPFHFAGAGSVLLTLLSWWAPTVLVSLSIFFFPEWLSRRVGWGGLLVWAVLIAAILTLSIIVLR